MNVLKALDEHVISDIDAAREEASVALSQYVDAMRRVAELESLAQLRKAMGGDLRPIALLRKEIA